MTTKTKTKRMKDRYDLEIEDIKKRVTGGERARDVIHAHWNYPEDHGGLFSFCAPDRVGDIDSGCLTQIKGSYAEFTTPSPKLSKEIRQSSLPESLIAVELSHLPQFARWQRKMDAMWPGRGEMQMPEGFEQRLREANSSSGEGKTQ